MVSVCSGALVYAVAGLLVGRRATTHWASPNLLSELDPTVVTEATHGSSTTPTSSRVRA
jgi:transcriptional regulator GlxA family with amidase domain